MSEAPATTDSPSAERWTIQVCLGCGEQMRQRDNGALDCGNPGHGLQAKAVEVAPAHHIEEAQERALSEELTEDGQRIPYRNLYEGGQSQLAEALRERDEAREALSNLVGWSGFILEIFDGKRTDNPTDRGHFRASVERAAAIAPYPLDPAPPPDTRED